MEENILVKIIEEMKDVRQEGDILKDSMWGYMVITLGVLAYVSYDVYKTRLKFRGAPNLISNEENSGMPGNFGF